MRKISARVEVVGDTLFLVPDGVRSLSVALCSEGFAVGSSVTVVEGEGKGEGEGVQCVNEIRELLDGGGEPAEVVARIEKWWDDK